MIQSYLFPISHAFMAFPFAALLFTLPFLIVQYRRHGYVNKVRAFVLYLFLLYLMNAVFLVMLPLPSSRHNPPLSGGAMQLVPFNFIQDILRETAVVKSEPSTYWRLLKERAFLQVVFNVLLTVPFGMLIRYYFRLGPLRSLLLSFLLSLFFEVTQLTGIYGFYEHAYRVFDVDDLMTNTLGGMIGFLAAEWLSGLLPRIENLDRDVDLSLKRVSYTRRAIALMFDYVICGVIIVLFSLLRLPGAYFAVTGLYFMVLPYLTGGCTFGKWLVRIRLTYAGNGGDARAARVDGVGEIPGVAGASGVAGIREVADVAQDAKDADNTRTVGAARDTAIAEEARVVGARPESVKDQVSGMKSGAAGHFGRPERIPLYSLILRYGILYWLLFGLNRMLAFSSAELPGISRLFLGLIVLAADFWFFIHVVKHMVLKDSTLFYEKLSKTHHRIMLQPGRERSTEH
ncbi:VanZ family protein [Paenibacillus sp. DYY-L-2]|uniref:VanZ family protein n=1 Tax=Paenibacillus sp. DYY-L-2 TaxID=3447013 RepID=UPI003F4F9841